MYRYLELVGRVSILGASVDPLSALANYGALGVMVAAFMLGLVYGKSTVDRLVQERDRADARAETMLDDYKQVVPVLERAIEAIKAADAKGHESTALFARVQAALEANTAAMQRAAALWERR